MIGDRKKNFRPRGQEANDMCEMKPMFVAIHAWVTLNEYRSPSISCQVIFLTRSMKSVETGRLDRQERTVMIQLAPNCISNCKCVHQSSGDKTADNFFQKRPLSDKDARSRGHFDMLNSFLIVVRM